LESGWRDIFYIAYQRYWTFFRIFVASLLWIPFLIFWKNIKVFLHCGNKLPLVFTLVCFIVLSSLFTEAISNGFLLYSSIAFFILIYLLLDFSLEQLKKHGLLRFVVVMPLVIIISYTNSTHMDVYKENFSYAKFFAREYSNTVGSCIPPNSSGLMRPTFSFALAKNRGYFEYTFQILFYMKENNLSFGEAILHKEFDYVAIDERDRVDMFTARDEWRGNSWYYSAISDIVISQYEFDALIEGLALIPICIFDEISHGKTIFYRVDKAALLRVLSH
jgi:hypothetical protein